MNGDRAETDGARVLDLVLATLKKYVVFPSEAAAIVVALFAAATHAMPFLEFAARLIISSPAKRCGKSRLLDVLAQLVARPLITSDISSAALVRSIKAETPPTLLLDEADAIFGKALKSDDKAEHLRGILNAGFGRDRPYRRWDVNSRKVEDYPSFAMAVLAGIGSLPDTIEDRGVVIRMRRRAATEAVEKYRIRRDKTAVRTVGEQLASWVTPHAEAIGSAEPDMPAGLNDRAEDVTEALLAIADLAGGTWPARARQAVRELAGAADKAATDAAEALRLLGDLRDVFEDQDALLGERDSMHTETILRDLYKIAEAPWADYSYGKPLSARDLAALLKEYEISSRDVKIDGVTKKGYRREHLHDAWTRYLPARPHSREGDATGATSATAQVSGRDQVAGSPGKRQPLPQGNPLTRAVAPVAPVADTPRELDPQTGPCARCGKPTLKYGPLGHQLCRDCRAARPDGAMASQWDQIAPGWNDDVEDLLP